MTCRTFLEPPRQVGWYSKRTAKQDRHGSGEGVLTFSSGSLFLFPEIGHEFRTTLLTHL